MAASIFPVTAIYVNGQYVFNDPNNVIDINGTILAAFSPRNAWLLRQIVDGTNQVQYLLTFSPSSSDIADVNTIQGLYLEEVGSSRGVLIDCISIDNFNLAANGTASSVQRRYGAAPAFTTPTAACWRITRADAGTAAAHGTVATDYVGKIYGNVRVVSNTSGISVYEVSAFGTLTAVKSDSVATC